MSIPDYSRVRVCSTATLRDYQAARRQVLSASALLFGLTPWALPRPKREYVAFHAWRSGWLDLDRRDAAVLSDLAAGLSGPADADRDRLSAAIGERGWLDDGSLDLAAIVDTAMQVFPALQNPWELGRFLERASARDPQVVVEIGTAAGGLFHALAQIASSRAILCAIDTFTGSGSSAVCDLLPALARRTQSVHVLRHNSLCRATRDELMRRLDGRPIDLLFIDGDHSYGAVRSDFETYSPLVAAGGLVALHDVLITPENSGHGFETGLYWRELVADRESEVIADPGGVPGLRSQLHVQPDRRRPASFGIGLIAM